MTDLVPGMKTGRFCFIRSNDPDAPAGDWQPVKPEDVPLDLRDPQILGSMVATPGCMASPRGAENGVWWYMVLRLADEHDTVH